MRTIDTVVTADGCPSHVAMGGLPPAELPAAITDPVALTSWWPEGAETDPRPGGEFHLWWEAMGWHLRGTYERVEPERITFTWAWDHEDLPARLVDLRIVRDGSATRLVLRRSAGSSEEAQSYLDGWLHLLPQLAERSDSSPSS